MGFRALIETGGARSIVQHATYIGFGLVKTNPVPKRYDRDYLRAAGQGRIYSNFECKFHWPTDNFFDGYALAVLHRIYNHIIAGC